MLLLPVAASATSSYHCCLCSDAGGNDDDYDQAADKAFSILPSLSPKPEIGCSASSLDNGIPDFSGLLI